MFLLCCECLVFRGGTVNGKMGVISLTAGEEEEGEKVVAQS